MPVVAVLLGFLDGEQIKYGHLIGFALIVSGVYMNRNTEMGHGIKSVFPHYVILLNKLIVIPL